MVNIIQPSQDVLIKSKPTSVSTPTNKIAIKQPVDFGSTTMQTGGYRPPISGISLDMNLEPIFDQGNKFVASVKAIATKDLVKIVKEQPINAGNPIELDPNGVVIVNDYKNPETTSGITGKETLIKNFKNMIKKLKDYWNKDVLSKGVVVLVVVLVGLTISKTVSYFKNKR